MARIAIQTIGCRVNQYEADQAAEQARASGHQVVEWGEPADVHIVHTCSVTNAAVRDGRQALRRALKHCDGSRVIASGCAARTDAATLIPDANVALYSDLEEAIADIGQAAIAGPAEGPPAVDMDNDTFPLPRHRTRTLLKIHDGCYFRCSFCIVPQARPVEASRPLNQAVEEARNCVAMGHREIVLTGVRITGYRPDGFGRNGLPELIRHLGDIEGLSRVRLTSLHPSEVSAGLLEVMASTPNVCRHLHLALQSGDDGVLRLMRRNYTASRFMEVVHQAREMMQGVAITTDVIAGFPGETEEAFGNTASLMREARFSRAHVFTYSPRPGTAAAGMPGQVPVAVAKERTRELIRIASGTGTEFRSAMVGSVSRVLVEQRRPSGLLEGLTDTYVEVRFDGPDTLRGEEVDVRITHVTGNGLRGELNDALPVQEGSMQ